MLFGETCNPVDFKYGFDNRLAYPRRYLLQIAFSFQKLHIHIIFLYENL